MILMSKKAVLLEVEALFKEAELIFPDKKANDLVKKARKKAMSVNLRLPSELKRKFCKHCYSFLKQGENVTVRTNAGKLIYTCGVCKKVWKRSLKSEV